MSKSKKLFLPILIAVAFALTYTCDIPLFTYHQWKSYINTQWKGTIFDKTDNATLQYTLKDDQGTVSEKEILNSGLEFFDIEAETTSCEITQTEYLCMICAVTNVRITKSDANPCSVTGIIKTKLLMNGNKSKDDYIEAHRELIKKEIKKYISP